MWIHTLLSGLALAFCASSALASVGLQEWPANALSGPITLFYPSQATASNTQRDGFAMPLAVNAPPLPGNRKLIVISHGSPASPWVHFHLAQTLVEAGFTVALPEHFADHAKDDSDPGPPSWKRRPQEISRAIDRLQQDARFAALDFAHIGLFGMSAGGHTALTLAGGRWSAARLRDHCEVNLEQDFHACAGLSVTLTGGLLDGLKKWLVLTVNAYKLSDASWHEHTDPRIVAIVSGVPFAADFDPASLRQPKAALAIISARQDQWLIPRFHSDAVLAACPPCTHLADLPNAGHGALLGPLPPHPPGRLAKLIADSAPFDRHLEMPKLNRTITDYFSDKLLPR